MEWNERLRLSWVASILESELFLPVLFFLFLLIGGTSLWQQPYDEVGDEALIGLQTERAAAFREGVGPYSRVGFHHPGPISFYYYALADAGLRFVVSPGQRYRLAQFFLNALLFLWAMALFRRLLPRRMALFYCAFFLIALAPVPSEFWFSVWGPMALLIPYLLFFAAYLGLSRGRLQDVLPGSIAAILVLHNHISGVTLLLPLTLIGFWKFFRQRSGRISLSRRDLVFSGMAIAFVVVSSIPPLVDELYGSGNLSKIYSYFTGHGSAARRFDNVLLYLTGYYLDPMRPVFAVHPVLWFGILTGLPLLVWNRLDAIWKSLHANLMLIFFLSLIAAMRVSGDLLPHLFWHLYPFVGFHLLIAVVSLISLLPLRMGEPRFLGWQTGLILLALVVTHYRPLPDRGNHSIPIEKVMVDLRKRPGPYRLVFPIGSKDHDHWVEGAGVALKLVREKREYCIDREWEFMFPSGSVCPEPFKGTAVYFRSADPGKPMTLEIREVPN